jgi:NAD-dependent oxidoreductase involved in siderophore biosynthesis
VCCSSSARVTRAPHHTRNPRSNANAMSTFSQRRLSQVTSALRTATAEASSPALAANAAAAAKPAAQVALVGAGSWATGWHLPHLDANPDCDIAAIVEMGDEHRAAMGEQYGCPTFATFEELIASDVQVDGVLISSPHRTHFDLGMMAIDAGYNVLIEKPMTVSAEEAQTLVDAAKAGGKIFMVSRCTVSTISLCLSMSS